MAGVNYIGLIPYLIKSIQEKDAEIVALGSNYAALQSNYTALDARLTAAGF